MTAAKTLARSSGRVVRVRNPKIEEPAPAPIPDPEVHYDKKTLAIYTIYISLFKSSSSLQ